MATLSSLLGQPADWTKYLKKKSTITPSPGVAVGGSSPALGSTTPKDKVVSSLAGKTPTPITVGEKVIPPEVGGPSPFPIPTGGAPGTIGEAGNLEPPKEPSALPSGDGKDDLIKKLTDALTKATTGKTAEETLTALQTERGVPALKETVGTFDEELGKAQDLLADLDQQIRRGMTRQESRLASTEVIRGKQEQLENVASIERGDILATIDTLQRGKDQATNALEREESDIKTILGLREAEKTQPLESLKEELAIRKTIRDFTKEDIPNVVSSQFNDAGDLTVITQDPNTGAFSTKTLPGIGKKENAYEQYYTQKNEAGDLTFFGVKDGKVEKLGTFAGVAEAGEKGTDWANELINLNSEASYEELYAEISGNTDLNDSAIKALLKSAGKKETQEGTELTEEWIKKTYTMEQLKTKAKAEGFTKGGFLGIGVGDEGVKDYINSLVNNYVLQDGKFVLKNP